MRVLLSVPPIVLAMLLYAIPSIAYIPAPSPPMLQYITLPAVLEVLQENIGHTIWNAVFPESLNDAIAIGISEGASGFTGGLAAKLVSLVDGNRESKDSTLTNAGSAGIFFAIRGIIRSVAEVLGGSTILITVASLTLATTISELVKLRGRAIGEQQKRVGNGPTMFDLMQFRNPKMQTLMNFRENEGKEPKLRGKIGKIMRRRPSDQRTEFPIIKKRELLLLGKTSPNEILSDFVKWFVYVISIPNAAYVSIEITANIGALAGICSQLIKENDLRTPKRLTLPIIEDEAPLARVSRAAFEGAVQFVTYEITRQWLLTVAPNPDRFLQAFNLNLDSLLL